MHPRDSNLQGYLAGVGSAEERRGLEAHLDGCAECRQVMHALAQPSVPPVEITLKPDLPPELDALLASSGLEHKFRIDRLLGMGGMGVVVAAWHRVLAQPVAIKFLHPSLRTTVGAEARFISEAQAASRLKSPHVVRLMDVERAGSGLPYIVMELLEGEDLHHRLARGPLALDEALRLTTQALDALAEAHAASVVHRDLKPANLFLTRDSRGAPMLKVLDFGLAKVISAGDSGLTQSGQVMGSPHFMSPEQLRGSRDVDPRTDVWSLGCVLYQMLTGTRPFSGDSFAEVAASVQRDAPSPLSKLRPDVPAALEALVFAMLEKDAARRPANVAQLAARLLPLAPADCTAALTALAGDASATGPQLSTAARPARTGWALAAAVVLTVGVALAWWRPWATPAPSAAPPAEVAAPTPARGEPVRPSEEPPREAEKAPPASRAPEVKPKRTTSAGTRQPTDTVFDQRE